ncbi:MAG: alpha/beta hydrolase [Planctomycetaceae bacterium]|nr:alpha/beta hydrolase [Planctomycetaceae bacterium]
MKDVIDFLIHRVLAILVALAIFLLLMGLGCADRLARFALFHPQKYTHELRGETFQEVWFHNSTKQKLHGCYFPYQKINPHEVPVGTILYIHGNGDNVSQMLDWADKLRSVYQCNVLIFDYAGYGKSEGKPTAPGVLDDGLAALTYLNQQENIPTDQVIVWGMSLGGSVAVDLASKHEVKALIVESSFSSLADMSRAVIPFLPAEILLWEKLSSVKNIGNVSCPVFISHGRADRTIPFTQGERLFESAKEPKTFFIPPEGLDYHCAPHSPEHSEALREFFGSL